MLGRAPVRHGTVQAEHLLCPLCMFTAPATRPASAHQTSAVAAILTAIEKGITDDIRTVDPLFDPADDSPQQQALADADRDHARAQTEEDGALMQECCHAG